MYLITNDNCQNCKMLKRMLGNKAEQIKTILASENMDLCRELGVRSVPCLVHDDNTVEFDFEEIVKIIRNKSK